MKTCPFCAEEVQEAAIKCKHSGSDLEAGKGRLRVSAFIPTKKGAEVDLVGCTREEVADAVERFFFAREFKRESGDKYKAAPQSVDWSRIGPRLQLGANQPPASSPS